ncbi:Uncharacterised protein [Mycobacterium tuberculosis]|nr:Uncharacterised protein [Mycobacterium tuberculosis]
MSCNVKASDPDSTVAPDFLVELATSSNSLEPDASVRLNAVSSATAIRLVVVGHAAALDSLRRQPGNLLP